MLVFSNPGELDIRLATTLGMNVKAAGGAGGSGGASSPIGQFGTGLKYAIAGVLRLGGQVAICSGRGVYEFRAQSETIRGKEFGVVQMFRTLPGDMPEGGIADPGWERLGFTTDLGAHWSAWELYRELWANSKDEGGGVLVVPEGQHPKLLKVETWAVEGMTRVVVESPELEAVHAERGRYILEPEAAGPPLWTANGVEVRWRGAAAGAAGEAQLPLVTYQGLRVLEELHCNRESLFSYNLLSKQELTEDRTLRSISAAERMIAGALLAAEAPEAIQAILTAPSAVAEGNLDYDWSNLEVSKEFLTAGLRMRRQVKSHSLREKLRKTKPAEWEKAEQELPETWEEILAEAPEVGEEEISAYELPCVSAVNHIIELRKALSYWRRVAERSWTEPSADGVAPSEEEIMSWAVLAGEQEDE